jgi:transcriptional regulator with XRE-family HTH domain
LPKTVQKSISSPIYAQFRSLLIEARKRAGLNQADLARRLRKPQSYVSKYETGERRLDLLEFITVARWIGVDPVRILRKLLRLMTD